MNILKKLLTSHFKPYSDSISLPVVLAWAYGMTRSILMSNENFALIQKKYGGVRLQEFIQFVEKYSQQKPEWTFSQDSRLLSKQDLSVLLSQLLQAVLPDSYTHLELVTYVTFKYHLNAFATRLFIMPLVDEKFKNESLEKLFYILGRFQRKSMIRKSKIIITKSELKRDSRYKGKKRRQEEEIGAETHSY